MRALDLLSLLQGKGRDWFPPGFLFNQISAALVRLPFGEVWMDTVYSLAICFDRNYHFDMNQDKWE